MGLSSRRRVPALFLDNSQVAFPLWSWRFLRRFEKSNLLLSPYAQNVLSELRLNFYKPPFSLQGKTVLDLGACCGESAWYFIEVLGAQKVFCVECDCENIFLLNYNRRVSNLPFEVFAEAFKLRHLGLPFDFLKCDIEGGEKLLVEYIEQYGFCKPCVVEVHSEMLKERFLAVGFVVSKKFTGPNFVCFLMNNYNSCFLR